MVHKSLKKGIVSHIALLLIASIVGLGASYFTFAGKSDEDLLGTAPRQFTIGQLGGSGTAGQILAIESGGIFAEWINNTGGGGGSDFAWTPTAYGVSTSTTLGFLNGFISTASSTFSYTGTTTFTGNKDTGGDDNVDGQRCFDDTSCIDAWTDITTYDAVAEVPSGTVNGVNTTFTLSQTPSDDDNVIIEVNGQVQRNGTDVTVTGTTVEFTLAPETGWTLFAHYNRAVSGFQSGLERQVVTKTTTYTITTSDGTVLADASSASFTITLPTAVGAQGDRYIIKKIDTTGNTVTIDGNGSETIDGGLTAVLTTPDESISIVSDNANWHIY